MNKSSPRRRFRRVTSSLDDVTSVLASVGSVRLFRRFFVVQVDEPEEGLVLRLATRVAVADHVQSLAPEVNEEGFDLK